MTRLYAKNLAYTTLVSDISSASTSLTLDDPSNFQSSTEVPFKLSIGSEIIQVGAIHSTTGVCFNLTRGDEGTDASAHASGDTVANKLTADTINDMWADVAAAVATVSNKVDSTGDTMSGDLNFNGNEAQNAVLKNVKLSTASTIGSGLDAQNQTISDAVLEGGSLRDAFDANDQIIGKAIIKDYAETPTTSTGVSGAVSIDIADGNYQTLMITGNTNAMTINNPSSLAVTTLVLKVLPTGDYTFTWLSPYTVVNASTTISASAADNSFNDSASGFAADVKAGDIITVAGFTATANNTTWRVASRTDNKITISSTVGLTTEAAGQSVSITRSRTYFVNEEVPVAAAAYIPKVFVMWTEDAGERWYISEAGEY